MRREALTVGPVRHAEFVESGVFSPPRALGAARAERSLSSQPVSSASEVRLLVKNLPFDALKTQRALK